MKSIYKILCMMITCGFLVAACDTDELHDLDINPQAVNEIDMNFLFTAAQLSAASGGSSGDNRFIDWRTNIGMCSYAIQHLANGGQGGIFPGDRYTHNSETSHAPFRWGYGDQLKNLADILQQTGPGGFAEGKNLNMREASRILRAWRFQRLTDFYGRIPYFEALKATAEDQIFFPQYDTQSAVYADLLRELDEASAALNASNPDEGFSAADLFFDGDITKWKRFGYSVMLRAAMRVSNVDQSLADTYVAKAIAGGVMASNDDNVWVPLDIGPSEWQNQNGISRAFFPGDGGQPSYLSNTLVDWLKGTDPNSAADDDPRLMILSGGIVDWSPSEYVVKDADPLNQKGMPNGQDQAGLDVIEGFPVVAADTYSRINFLLMQDDEPYMIMNYGEVELLLAEAAERGIGGASDAATHYENGVRASMQHFTPYDASLTVDDAAVDAYLATYPYGVTKPALEMIGEQLWVNGFLNWWESWSNWRRTGFPTLTPVNFPGNETNGTIPQRLRYPEFEIANPNFDAGKTTPDEYTTLVWWAGGAD
ncbi:SusD/RagB family nutrient-binding outer membrane lipoprotein [Fulvivirgaceae bacterium BMA12]|uniref:SusD/RagB family nutrient-binding outer membrane lipoprotein n=1 Tax=Agaribacillus aureus TaxID=3051825 RepID=A0ABT8LAK9_9BACT|nr:SusD/RagB family nutrient-binding outer membrane lipoprotein [Fulvivirgaceae bacterium BMA12]